MELDKEEMDAEGGFSSQPCAQCALPIDNESSCVECFGRCKLAIHVHCLPGATSDEIESLKKIKNAMFVCDACLSLAEFDDGHYEKRLDEIAKKLNDLAGVAEMIKSFEQVIRKVVREEIVRVNERCENDKTGKDNIPRRMITRSSAKRKKIDETEIQSDVAETPKTSFAEVLRKGRNKIPEQSREEKRKPNPVVIVKPKAGIKVEDVRAELRKKSGC